jgi:uncharacterized membrane protein YfcA
MKKMSLTTLLLLMLSGVLAGVFSGLIGIGGGIIMVPMLLLLGLTHHQAQGTSLATLMVPVTFLAVMNYHKEGHVQWHFAIVIAVCFFIGGFLGSKIAVNLDQKMIKKIFAVVLIVVAGKLLWEK